MSTIKTALKSAKAALDSQDFAEAVKHSRKVLEFEPDNYFANVFLGRALEKQDALDEAAESYESATKIKPNDELAWKGLCNLCEAQGSRAVAKHTEASVKLAQIYADQDDAHQSQSVVDKLVDFAREKGSREEYKGALQVLLPTSPIFGFLEGRIQKPSYTYAKLAEITEADDKEQVNRLIGERRTRLGAKLGQVTAEAIREVFAKSHLENLYQSIINWTSDDEERRIIEEKLLQHAYDHLVALAPEDKAAKRARVMKLAHDMVIIQHPYRLAWDLELEWGDFQDLHELDKTILQSFITFFPNAGPSKIICGFFGLVRQVRRDSEDGSTNAEGGDSQQTPMNAEQRLILLTDGLEDASSSAFGYRVVAEYFLHIEEYESCVDTSRKAKDLLISEKKKSGLQFENNLDAVNTALATSYVYYQSPKNHPEARALFSEMLKRKTDYTPALLGIGLVYEEQEEYEKAANFLDRAAARDPGNLTISAEAAWCGALNGNIEKGLEDLNACMAKAESSKNVKRELISQIQYRIGKCKWDVTSDRKSRKDRKGPYANFLSAIRLNPSYAPAYTSLGLYYESYANDKKRARQCFQKAFEQSATEILAAEHLARNFADNGEWDIVEVIAQRVIDSGAVKPSPGSKRKAVSWPFAAIAVVQMNKAEYPGAVISFQSALRISPKDHNSWIGLGESYLCSGRYNAASRTLEHALDMANENQDQSEAWFAHYMYANVRRELADCEEAVAGYQKVLEERPDEFGVLIALLQTLVENARLSFERGFFINSTSLATRAVLTAKKMYSSHSHTVNYWKAVADSCAIFCSLPRFADRFPLETLGDVFKNAKSLYEEDYVASLDDIDFNIIHNSLELSNEQDACIARCFAASILASKQAVSASSNDLHAQSISWYNLGWSEYQASKALGRHGANHLQSLFSKCLRASIKCFKRSIELEAGNADFWNALGVSTIGANPKVAQHSFVRSLHINERNPATWANLGCLYLGQDDIELAHQAFSRAQSIDPDYVEAWIGEGAIAFRLGDLREALLHFTHAVDISDASDVAGKTRFVSAAFDDLISSSSQAQDMRHLVTPIFAIDQIQAQVLSVSKYRHLLALLLERLGEFQAATDHLISVCETFESEYEQRESPATLGQFIRGKCDLARIQLEARDFDGAAENAGTVLDLSADIEDGTLSKEDSIRIRLSAQLTSGLAHYHVKDTDQSIRSFREALQGCDGDADVVALLAKVLWAKGGQAERSVAKEQLFDCAEKKPGSLEVLSLLGSIAAIEGDASTQEAIVDDLEALRASGELNTAEQDQVEDVLEKLSAVVTDEADASRAISADAERSIMLFPSKPHGWSRLQAQTEDPFVAETAVTKAERSVPPEGVMNAEDLSKVLCDVRTVRSAQRSIMLCPWRSETWGSFVHCIS